MAASARKQTVSSTCWFILVTATACAGSSTGGSPPVRSRVESTPKVFQSPNGHFEISYPKLMTPGARASNKEQLPGYWGVMFTDDLCRIFALIEAPDTAATLDMLVSTRFSPGSVVQSSTPVTLPAGEAILARVNDPQATPPCEVVTIRDGRQTKGDAGLEQAVVVTRANNRLYYALYAVGFPEGADMPAAIRNEKFGIRVAPADSVVLQFARTLVVKP